jgi:2-iminobutanoate/2-iminopropanoate deaminase
MRPVFSPRAPEPVGPYSQAIAHAGVLYLSGQVPLDPATGALVGDSIEAQTERVLENLFAVLEAAGADASSLLRVGVYLVDMADFPRMNAVYARMLGDSCPARSTIAVAALPLGARVEIDAIAALGAPA